jgi:hypothetical protein
MSQWIGVELLGAIFWPPPGTGRPVIGEAYSSSSEEDDSGPLLQSHSSSSSSLLGDFPFPPPPPPPPQGEALWTDLVPPGCWQNWLWIACPDYGDLGHGCWYVLSRHGGWVNPRVWRAGNPQEQ